MLESVETGRRIRLARIASGLGQVELADLLGVASGSVSKIENGRLPVSHELLTLAAQRLDVSQEFLVGEHTPVLTSRPWLRAYADAPKRAVDQQLATCTLAIEAVDHLELRTIPDTIPVFDGDLSDTDAIEHFVTDVRTAAQLREGDVVGNSIRAAERLGCIVLPMREELGRHLGMSIRANTTPMICVSRPLAVGGRRVPGDRRRFTVAHELGHLALHSGLPAPATATDASHIERQAHLFAGAFLAPADAILEDLYEHGGRVTLKALTGLKERWGVSIKALVVRFRSLSVIDEHHARSLYKQISARGWNTSEPVVVGNEEAVWLNQALRKRFPGATDHVVQASQHSGVGGSHFGQWTNWSTASHDHENVVDITARRAQQHSRRI